MDNRLLSVYIVDDEKLIRDGMKKLLQWDQYGFHICGEAGNGRDALREILDMKPDIVLTDLRMPAMPAFLSSPPKKLSGADSFFNISCGPLPVRGRSDCLYPPCGWPPEEDRSCAPAREVGFSFSFTVTRV